jgi:hypothetical protein
MLIYGVKDHHDMQEVIEALYAEPFMASELVGQIENLFPDDYPADVGLWQRYTLREHTLMVMGQFEKYFSDRELPVGLGRDHFRLFLAMHDLGKPEAVRKKRKHDQSIFNLIKFDAHYPGDGFITEGRRSILRSLLTDDPIGPYLRGFIDVDHSAEKIREMHAACHSSIPLSDYHDLLLVYYMSDAGSYTVDAGGLRGLDHLFIFGERRMAFSPDTESKMERLRKVLISK